MKTIKSFISLFFVVLLLLATSCQEVVEILTAEENPYNYVGQQHNQMLDDFASTYEKELSAIQAPMDKEIFIAEKVFDMKGADLEDFQKGRKMIGIETTQALINVDYLRYDDHFKMIGFTGKSRDLLGGTIAQLIEIDGTTATGLAKIEVLIRDLEVDFMENQNAEDFAPVMSYLATLKSSADYWNEHNKAANARPWWQIVLADAIGAGIGAVIGGATAVPLAAGFSLAVKD
ncbi:hypothetical protein N9933_00875 [bacterium]|nr:hypothetical protein [bacterium]